MAVRAVTHDKVTIVAVDHRPGIVVVDDADAGEIHQRMVPLFALPKGFQGARGRKPANMKAIEDLLLSVSKMAWTNKKIKELDLNPVFANDKKAIAVDMRVMVD